MAKSRFEHLTYIARNLGAQCLMALSTLAVAVTLTCCASTPALAGWFDPPAPSSDKRTADELERLLKQGNQLVGMPGIVNFFERRMVRQLYELRDDPNFRTYSYIVTMTGDFVKICDSVGFGINASIQLANPMKVYHDKGSEGRSAAFMPQAEPNGLFMPEGLAATYVMCLNPAGDDLKPVYVEPEVVVSPFPIGD